ncbi:MAG: hypothetical protein A2X05_03190 [Bacteroidetes bacterium GWE2_41_25]|nr:MAG: hypothetical protein A2X03_16230 [Bacteroidetes bacterium GWA2_40_15]OFX91785.1 MAG: hypothetical protein A2X05_03190 [Bacteroidetes bacterium GWE2_41_25]OFX94081.1 MAG: hypothetical protein A2X06_15140 [Bacteroidetes bacterium GWC2_40_22]OFY58225.1 MAG: hypothetical protein A2X04_10710 [Bacteroidetes bacterium GWF2_41_9]
MKRINLFLLMILALFLQSFGMQHGNHSMSSDGFSPLLWLFLIILVITTGIILYKFVSRSSTGINPEECSDAIGIIKSRFANGEINKNTYADILFILNQDSGKDYIEKLKIRLAKGEITISEFNEMSELLIEG